MIQITKHTYHSGAHNDPPYEHSKSIEVSPDRRAFHILESIIAKAKEKGYDVKYDPNKPDFLFIANSDDGCRYTYTKTCNGNLKDLLDYYELQEIYPNIYNFGKLN